VESWSSDLPSELYLLVPLYLPFDAENFSDSFGEERYPKYSMSDADGENGLDITVLDAFNMVGKEPQGTIDIDGRTYYYTSGTCSVDLWETSGAQPAFIITGAAYLYGCVTIEEELPDVLESMVRVEGTGGETWQQ
jgi:hypothetical protein